MMLSSSSSRSSSSSVETPMRCNSLGSVGTRTLIVGEGDFSLSRSLIHGQDDASNLTATTILSAQQMRSIQGAMTNIQDLVSRGSTVLHEVDGRHLRRTDGIRDNYDPIIFSFPYVSWGAQRDNASLVTDFLRSASSILRNEGEIMLILHVSKKGICQFDDWGVEASARSTQLTYLGFSEFAVNLFPGFTPKHATDHPFNFHGARSYVFKREMSATYDVFRDELERAAASTEHRALSAAALSQIEDLNSIIQTRGDRSAALVLSQRWGKAAEEVYARAPKRRAMGEMWGSKLA